MNLQDGDVYLICIIGDDYIIGKYVSETDNEYIMKESRRIKLLPKDKGFALVFLPTNMFVDKSSVNNEIKINKSNIIRVDDKSSIRSDVMENYFTHMTELTKDNPEESSINKNSEAVNPEVV